MNAIVDPNLTAKEYYEMLKKSLEEIDQIGVTEEDMEKIGTDLAAVLALLVG